MAMITTPGRRAVDSRGVPQGSRLGPRSQASSSSSSSTSSPGSSMSNRILRLFHRYEYTSPPSLEPLYRLYSYPAEYSSLRCLIVLFLAVTLSLAVVDFVLAARPTVDNVSCVVLCIASVVALVFVHTRYMSPRQLPTVALFVVFLCVCFAVVSFPVDFQLRPSSSLSGGVATNGMEGAIAKNSDTPGRRVRVLADGVWRVCYVIFALYSFIPLRVYVPLIVGTLLPIAHTIVAGLMANDWPSLLWKQITANLLIYVTVNIAGLYVYDGRERIRRRLFESIWTSLAGSLLLLAESDKTGRLLHCILPPHVATDMFSDMRTASTEQQQQQQQQLNESTRRTYLQCHDSVSILYAHVSGLSTLAAGHCSATEFVRLLNELFGRFDQLAMERHCLRVQLLGNTYECVSGLPDRRPDHAKCCVELALDMIDIVTSIRELTEVPLCLRAGVHSGRVLGGVVGGRRWAWDVWGEDINIAQHTHTICLPGRILVTQSTLDHLHGEFATDYSPPPASFTDQDKSTRDEEEFQRIRASRDYLSSRGIDTYYIVAEQLKKRYNAIGRTTSSAAGYLSSANGRLSFRSSNNLISRMIGSIKFNAEIPLSGVLPQTSNLLHAGTTLREFQRTKSSDTMTVGQAAIFDRLKKRLMQSIVARITLRPASREDTRLNYFTLCLKSSVTERKYKRVQDSMFPASMLVSLVMLVLTIAMHAVVLPRTLLLLILFLVTFAWISVVLILFLGFRIKCIRCDIRRSSVIRQCLTLVTLLLVFTVSLLNVLCCRGGLFFPSPRASPSPISSSFSSSASSSSPSYNGHIDSVLSFSRDYHVQCDLPHYIYLSAIATCLYVTLYVSMSAVVKLIFLFLVAIGYVTAMETVVKAVFTRADQQLNPDIPTDVSAILMLVHLIALIYVQSRDTEWTLRLDFLWKLQTTDDSAELGELESTNLRLLANLLPHSLYSRYAGTSTCCARPPSPSHTGATLQDVYRHTGALPQSDTVQGSEHQTVAVAFISIDDLQTGGVPSDGSGANRNQREYNCTDARGQLGHSFRLLDHIWTTFDESLDDERYRGVEKIKTFGTTYMAAVGLTQRQHGRMEDDSEEFRRQAADEMLEFILTLREKLKIINRVTNSSFKLRAGVDMGSLISGLIGARRPRFDLWGATVNNASKLNRSASTKQIKVTAEVNIALRGSQYHFVPCHFQSESEVHGQEAGVNTTSGRCHMDATAYLLVCDDVGFRNRQQPMALFGYDSSDQLANGKQSYCTRDVTGTVSSNDDVAASQVLRLSLANQSAAFQQFNGQACPVVHHAGSVSSCDVPHHYENVTSNKKPSRSHSIDETNPATRGQALSSNRCISITPPTGIGHRRKPQECGSGSAGVDPMSSKWGQPTSSTAGFLAPPTGEAYWMEDPRGRSPDLPVFHYRNVNMQNGCSNGEVLSQQSATGGKPDFMLTRQSLLKQQQDEFVHSTQRVVENTAGHQQANMVQQPHANIRSENGQVSPKSRPRFQHNSSRETLSNQSGGSFLSQSGNSMNGEERRQVGSHNSPASPSLQLTPLPSVYETSEVGPETPLEFGLSKGHLEESMFSSDVNREDFHEESERVGRRANDRLTKGDMDDIEVIMKEISLDIEKKQTSSHRANRSDDSFQGPPLNNSKSKTNGVGQTSRQSVQPRLQQNSLSKVTNASEQQLLQQLQHQPKLVLQHRPPQQPNQNERNRSCEGSSEQLMKIKPGQAIRQPAEVRVIQTKHGPITTLQPLQTKNGPMMASPQGQNGPTFNQQCSSASQCKNRAALVQPAPCSSAQLRGGGSHGYEGVNAAGAVRRHASACDTRPLEAASVVNGITKHPSCDILRPSRATAFHALGERKPTQTSSGAIKAGGIVNNRQVDSGGVGNGVSIHGPHIARVESREKMTAVAKTGVNKSSSPPPLPPPPKDELLRNSSTTKERMRDPMATTSQSSALISRQSAFRPVLRPIVNRARQPQPGPPLTKESIRTLLGAPGAPSAVAHQNGFHRCPASANVHPASRGSEHGLRQTTLNQATGTGAQDQAAVDTCPPGPLAQSKRWSHCNNPHDLRLSSSRLGRSLEQLTSDGEDTASSRGRGGFRRGPGGEKPGTMTASSRRSSERRDKRGAFDVTNNRLHIPDNVSLSSFGSSELSRSDPTLNYDSSSAHGSTYESEYDNYRPGMASDEDYFVPDPISDIDIDMFDDAMDVDNITVGGEAMTDTYGYLPLSQKINSDI